MINALKYIILTLILITQSIHIPNPIPQVAQRVQLEDNTETSLKSLGIFKLTAYCSCEKCCDGWALVRPKDENGNDIVIGASGEQLQQNFSVAVDKKLIPYGTYLYIDGIIYKAQDCGGSIKNKRIDVYFNNHQDALEFGVQYKEVFAYE